MPSKVQIMARMWDARIQHGGTGHLPMQFDMNASLASGRVETEVLTGRTTGTQARYVTKQLQNGGVIPYYWFDRSIVFNQPNQRIEMAAVQQGNAPARVVPSMAHAFVIMSNGEFRVAPPMTMTGRFNHAHIADMATDVLYAGTISFGRIGQKKGLLDWWSNDSGAYRCPDSAAAVAGLPMERYNAPRWVGLYDPVGNPVYA
ncbi:MAG: hypothetical protein WBC44_17945 [Planctomycetaceae bacterium]